MERADFEALIERMERVAVERPMAYRRRVFGLAALGYGYLFFVVLVLLVLSALSIWSLVYLKGLGLKLVLIVGALLYAVLRSLWVKQDPPPGEKVTAADAPKLLKMIEELQRCLQTPAIHTVLITPEFNAAVSQVPRMGLFGWHRNFLVLGLPLMKGLTVEQFKSVLAHELGHLSRGHARAANWIYRMRVIWSRLESTFERRPQWGSGLIRQFFANAFSGLVQYLAQQGRILALRNRWADPVQQTLKENCNLPASGRRGLLFEKKSGRNRQADHQRCHDRRSGCEGELVPANHFPETVELAGGSGGDGFIPQMVLKVGSECIGRFIAP